MIFSKKKQFLLINDVKLNKLIFNLIIKNIPHSIFSKLNFFFFKKIIQKKLVDLYLIKKKKKISAIISVTSVNNYSLIKKEILKYLFLNPLIVILNLSFFLNLPNRDSNEIDLKHKNKFLHLLHFIILKKQFSQNSLKEKDSIVNFFFKKIINKYNANYFYLCYEKSNIRAHKYYKRNKFKIYKRNKNIIFVKKKVV